jgi:hypothetical protein
LVSPTYFGHNAIWYIPPDQEVGANAMARARFGRNATKYEFSNVLIYKLQRKKCIESNEQSKADSISEKDTSTSLQLLVMWISNDKHRYSVRALLIKHSNTITWNEDTLEKLHSMYLALFNKGLRIDVLSTRNKHYSVKDTWLLDNVTVLIIELKWEEESRTFEITISKGTGEHDTVEPLWVSSSM